MICSLQARALIKRALKNGELEPGRYLFDSMPPRINRPWLCFSIMLLGIDIKLNFLRWYSSSPNSSDPTFSNRNSYLLGNIRVPSQVYHVVLNLVFIEHSYLQSSKASPKYGQLKLQWRVLPRKHARVCRHLLLPATAGQKSTEDSPVLSYMPLKPRMLAHSPAKKSSWLQSSLAVSRHNCIDTSFDPINAKGPFPSLIAHPEAKDEISLPCNCHTMCGLTKRV